MPDSLTRHAKNRCRTRGIPLEAVEAALDYGAIREDRGAEIYTLGWRAVQLAARLGLDLSRWEGVEVVRSHNGRVLTVYRNRNPHALRLRKAA